MEALSGEQMNNHYTQKYCIGDLFVATYGEDSDNLDHAIKLILGKTTVLGSDQEWYEVQHIYVNKRTNPPLSSNNIYLATDGDIEIILNRDGYKYYSVKK